MSEPRRILVADDEPHIREVVEYALVEEGFEVVEASDGRETLRKVDDRDPDLVVLDIMMPEMDGKDVCRELRAESDVPIVFLSSRDDEVDRIVGLELGGDDYVTKPFSPKELVARVKAVLRRSGSEGDSEIDSPESRDDSGGGAGHERRVAEVGALRLDLDSYRASWEGHEIELTKTEFGMLETLMGRPGKVYSRDELMDGAYDDGTVVSDRTIDSHVRRIRDKFDAFDVNPIETVRGLGYKLDVE